jgi:hypothetical protein
MDILRAAHIRNGAWWFRDLGQTINFRVRQKLGRGIRPESCLERLHSKQQLFDRDYNLQLRNIGRLGKNPDAINHQQEFHMDLKQKELNESSKKRTYTPPKFVSFGDVRSLTQSGSRNGKEIVGGGGDGLKTPKP